MNNATRAGETLEVCPFCGGDAQFERVGTPRQSTIVACSECACRLESPDEFNYSTSWNRRTPSPAAAELLAVCRLLLTRMTWSEFEDLRRRAETVLAKFPADSAADVATPGHQTVTGESKAESA